MGETPSQSPVIYILLECPLCDEGWMEVRTARVSGRKFLGCTQYPHCKATVSYDETTQRLAEEVLRLQEQIDRMRGQARKRKARSRSHLSIVEGGRG